MDDFDARFEEATAMKDWDAAATLLINHFGPRIHGYLRAVLRDEDLADDVFQAWAENAWKGLPSRRPEANLKAWTYRVAWNAATRTFRDGYQRRRERFATSMASRLAESIALASRAASMARKQDRLERLRAELSPEEQSLLTLKLDRGLSWEEVAEVMAEEGAAPNETALRKRFQRLRERLAKLLSEPDPHDKA
jgi:RNA polymerase sigma-70 factor (ECF subfamily)